MPTYEYKCEECGHEWEREQSIKDPPLATCPRCVLRSDTPTKGRPKRQIPQHTGFVLNGRGWARDGYKG